MTDQKVKMMEEVNTSFEEGVIKEIKKGKRIAPNNVTIKNRNALRILVAGYAGVGKSSFLKAFFNDGICRGEGIEYKPVTDRRTEIERDLEKIDGTTTKVLKEYGPYDYDSPTSLLLIHVVDTPGINDTFNVLDWVNVVENYLNSKHKEFRNNPRTEAFRDPRVTCIIYIMSPMRMTGADIFIIKALSRAAMVIPVVGKADTMDPKEREEWKKTVYDMIMNKLGNTQNQDNLSKDYHVETFGKQYLHAIIGSEKGLTRKYGDGKEIDITDEKISDTSLLFSDLIKNYHDIHSILNDCKEISLSENVKSMFQTQMPKFLLILAGFFILLGIFKFLEIIF